MVAWDWLVLLALTFWVGILAMEWLVISWAAGNRTGTGNALVLPDQIARQSMPLQWLCLAALLVGEVITLILRTTLLTQGLGGGGIDPGALGQLIIATSYGYLWLVRIVCIIAALGLLRWTTREQSTNTTLLEAGHPKSRFSRLREQVALESGAELPIADEHTSAENVGAGLAPALHDSPGEAAPQSASLPYWYRGVGLALAT